MIKSILAATVIAFGMASAAHAAQVKPSASPNVSVSSDLVQVGKKSYKRAYKGKGKYRGPKYRGRKYYRGGYDRPPRGWRGYHYRPYGWRARGCISVGPLWYCP
jgi:opacity protein-like surface antigen